MLAGLKTFFEERFGWGTWARSWLDISAPGGARLSRSFGTALIALFLLECTTGIALGTVYTPGVSASWSSTFYLQAHLAWGGFIRGLHHWAGQAMLVVCGLHLVTVLFSGAYRAPREGTWWLGLALLMLAFLSTHTGMLLPWDQQAYWTVRVESGIAGTVPVVGSLAQRLLQGGTELGQLTVARLHTAHVAILPLAMVIVIWGHVALVKRHGLSAPASVDLGNSQAKSETIFPKQATLNVVVALLVLITVWVLARRGPVPLDAPADPDVEFPARPEWFLLGLFKLRKLFSGEGELVGTLIIPGIVSTVMVLLPWLDRGADRSVKKRLVPISVGLVCVGFVAGITGWAYRADRHDRAYQQARLRADRRAVRAKELAWSGIPVQGPAYMVRNDPVARMREIYDEHCAVCHAPPGTPLRDARGNRTSARAPALEGFGTRDWARSVLARPDADDLFGRTPIGSAEGSMASQTRRLRNDVDAVVEYLFAQANPGDRTINQELATRGEEVTSRRCAMCHIGPSPERDPEEDAPYALDLRGWGSHGWIREQIVNPASPSHYGASRNRMPAFSDRLSPEEIELVTNYMMVLRTRPAPRVEPPAPPAPRPNPEG